MAERKLKIEPQDLGYFRNIVNLLNQKRTEVRAMEAFVEMEQTKYFAALKLLPAPDAIQREIGMDLDNGEIRVTDVPKIITGTGNNGKIN